MWSVVDPMTIAANRFCRMVIAVEVATVSRAYDDLLRLSTDLRHDKDNIGL
jgi:hypothetical protein